MNFEDIFDDDYFDDSFGEFENFLELENKIKKYHYAMRRKNRPNDYKDENELPTADMIEQLVEYCISSQKFDEALDFCNLWIEYYPASLEAKNSFTYILICLSRFNEAIISADKVLETYENDTEALLHKAMSFEGIGEPETSIELLEKILEIEPDNEIAKGLIALAYKNRGNFDEAIEYFEQLIQAFPDEPENYAHLAACYNDLQDFEQAISYCKTAIDLSPYSEDFWYNLGATYANQKNYDDAIEAFMMTLAIDEQYFPALTAIAKAYFDSGNNIKSAEFFRQALILKPNDSETLTDYSTVLADSGDFIQAINHLQMAVKNSPLTVNNQSHRAFFGLGICYCAINNEKKALEHFDKALTVKPNHKDTLSIKADILFSLGRFVEAIKVFEILQSLDKKNLMYLFSLGKCFYMLQDYDNATYCFMQMFSSTGIKEGEIELFSRSFYWLAKIEIKKENFDRAAAFLLQAFDLDDERRLDYLLEFPALLEKKYTKFNRKLKK